MEGKKNEEIMQFNEYEKQKRENGGFTQLIHSHEKGLNYKINLSFIKIKDSVDPNDFQLFRSKELEELSKKRKIQIKRNNAKNS